MPASPPLQLNGLTPSPPRRNLTLKNPRKLYNPFNCNILGSPTDLKTLLAMKGFPDEYTQKANYNFISQRCQHKEFANYSQFSDNTKDIILQVDTKISSTSIYPDFTRILLKKIVLS